MLKSDGSFGEWFPSSRMNSLCTSVRVWCSCTCVRACMRMSGDVRRVGHGHRINSEQDTTIDRQSSFEVARYVLHNLE